MKTTIFGSPILLHSELTPTEPDQAEATDARQQLILQRAIIMDRGATAIIYRATDNRTIQILKAFGRTTSQTDVTLSYRPWNHFADLLTAYLTR